MPNDKRVVLHRAFPRCGKAAQVSTAVLATTAATVAAVLAYRIILFWLPLVGGAIAFALLRRALDRADRPDLCVPIPAT